MYIYVYTYIYRVYEWTLIGTVNKKRSFVAALISNILLLAIIITVFVYRADVAIRMFYHIHVILFCISAMMFCWGNALLYQVCACIYLLCHHSMPIFTTVQECIYIYTYICIYIYVYIYIYIYMYIYIYIYTHI
jgi:hypothetical protein